MNPLGDESFPILSGAFDSLELTETQQKLLDVLNPLGKMSLIVSETQAPFRVEKLEGLENFIYQLNKKQEASPTKLTREFVEKLENDTRYENRKEKIGNKTEFVRLLLHTAMDNPKIKELVAKVIDEQIDLADKRSNYRRLAETSKADEIGN